MPSTAVTLTARFEAEFTDVLVGDVVWAKSNLSANNTFAANAYDYGALFIYGSSVAYYYDTGAAPPYPYSATSWPTANDPCPDGWRVPTEAEFNALLSAATNKVETTVINHGVRYTLPNGTLFLPAAGIRLYDGASKQGVWGNYWSSTYNSSQSFGRMLTSSNGTTGIMANAGTYAAYSVRCVRPQ
jgi:uncharacterized protein (TIGR02145 family)